MKTSEILKIIKENGGFNNFNKWNTSEKALWVRSYFNCSYFVSKKVAELI